MSLSEKWINIIYRTATGSRKFRTLTTPVGAIIFISFVSSLIFLSFLLDKFFKFTFMLSHPINIYIGVPILSIGILLDLICIYFFIKVKGSPVPLNPPPVLVNKGPYAYVRNPMLTGLFAQLFGFGIACNSISLTFIITPVFIFLNYFELKKIEEPELEKRLGKEYIEYKKRVRRLI